MPKEDTVRGKVLKSSVPFPRHPNLLTTTVELQVDKGQRIPYSPFDGQEVVKINIPGSHQLGGRRVSAVYQYCTGVLWASSYSILDRRGRVIHEEQVEPRTS